MRSQSAEQLRRALTNARDAEFEAEFPLEKTEAETLLHALRRRAAVEMALRKLDNTALFEVVNFSKPPKMVHSAIAAAFILSGTPSAATRVSVVHRVEHCMGCCCPIALPVAIFWAGD